MDREWPGPVIRDMGRGERARLGSSRKNAWCGQQLPGREGMRQAPKAMFTWSILWLGQGWLLQCLHFIAAALQLERSDVGELSVFCQSYFNKTLIG